MNRPTKQVILPISKKVAEVYTYYLRGERKEIEALMLEGVRWKASKKGGKPEMVGVDTTYRSKMDDRAVLLAINKLTNSNKEAEDITIEALDNLPDEDFNTLQESLPNQKKK